MSTLRRGEHTEDVTLAALCEFPQMERQRLARRGDLDAMTPSVTQRGLAPYQLQIRQVVDERDHICLVDAKQISQLLLSQRTELLHCHEHREVRQADVVRGQHGGQALLGDSVYLA